MQKLVSVIVPVYKDFNSLSNEELISLRQLYRVLGGYEIFLAGPETLEYNKFLKEAKKHDVSIKWEHFSWENFDGIKGYNRLMKSHVFYNRFRQFKYVLIYQLDAYVFRDELSFWCNRGYDYIGAPWTGIYLYKDKPLVGVGNGGFSIRNVSTSIRTLKNLQVLQVLNQYKNLNWKGLIPRLPQFLIKLVVALKSSKSVEESDIQEDIFWCKVAPSKLSNVNFNSILFKLLAKSLIKNNFKIAPHEIALQFSIETKAHKLYNLNNGKLPFGCHAWEKYEPEFWKAFIPQVISEN